MAREGETEIMIIFPFHIAHCTQQQQQSLCVIPSPFSLNTHFTLIATIFYDAHFIHYFLRFSLHLSC